MKKGKYQNISTIRHVDHILKDSKNSRGQKQQGEKGGSDRPAQLVPKKKRRQTRFGWFYRVGGEELTQCKGETQESACGPWSEKGTT